MEMASLQVLDQYNISLALAIALQVTASAKKIGKLEFRKFSLRPSYSTDKKLCTGSIAETSHLQKLSLLEIGYECTEYYCIVHLIVAL